MSVKFSARAALAAAALAVLPALAVDSVKMMIPANPGGGWDTTGRELGKAMTASGAVKNIQYDNKGGAAGTIGLAQFVNSAKGDPNALMMGGMVMVGGIIQNKSAVNLSQVTPVARLTSEYEVIVVPASGPKTLKELLDKFKANPGSVSWGGGSAGGTDHILAGLIAKAIGVEPSKVNYVPFKGGGEAVSAIIGGHVTAGVSGYSEFAQHIKSGKMRALATFGAERSKSLPDVPTMKELGYDVTYYLWVGLFAPKGTPAPVVSTLGAAIDKAAASRQFIEPLTNIGLEPSYLPAADFAKFWDEDVRRAEDTIRQIGKVG
jgi:putative tricarboxylic transport membrane protein